ncbi:MAG: polyribonucleotide nucleotidyltransferase [Proteobacteria bacterium]|nr:polyribonucleotide nucleotidyltransferase [Pseudomonadota bacterium]
MVDEEILIKSIEEANQKCLDLVNLLDEFANEVNPGIRKIEYIPNILDDVMVTEIKEIALEDLDKAFNQGLDKIALNVEIRKIKDLVLKKIGEKYDSGKISQVFELLEKKILQKMILEDNKRPDGRGQFDLRELSSKVSYLPKVHGSGLFTRGITQALSVATLGSIEDALVIQDFYGEETKYYIHHYNFPPYCSGEIGKTGGGGSREIGHGMLTERGLKAVIPSISEFPYTIMVNTEITSSSGSTSMAAACGSCLALMDAGVPLKDMVAGIGVGLVVNDDFSKYKIITDIAYLEDAGGFMDFKMIGTRKGVTALQCDIKLTGIPMKLIPDIIRQSKDARMRVLDHMSQTISEPRKDLSPFVPKYDTIQISPDKIGVVIGSGGKTIKDIQAKTQTTLSIEDSGKIIITGHSMDEIQNAKNMIDGLTREIKAGEIYKGKVVKVVEFGAFVEILPGKEGLLHVSEISKDFVKDVKSVVKEGEEFEVMVKSVENGKISLSRKSLL